MKIVLIKFLSKLHLGEILCENKIMTYKGNKYKIFIYKLSGTYYCSMNKQNGNETFLHCFSEQNNLESKTLPLDVIIAKMIKNYDGNETPIYMIDWR